MQLSKDFYGRSASLLGTYEAVAILSGKRTPTLSTFCARRRYRRLLLCAWVLGLAVHVARHTVDD